MDGPRPWRRGVGMLTLVALTWLQGAGAAGTYLDAEGRAWVAFPHPEGIGLRSSAGRLVLLPSCTARSEGLGTGRWSWANGGFRVLFATRTFLFPRQEPPLDDPSGRCLL